MPDDDKKKKKLARAKRKATTSLNMREMAKAHKATGQPFKSAIMHKIANINLDQAVKANRQYRDIVRKETSARKANRKK